VHSFKIRASLLIQWNTAIISRKKGKRKSEESNFYSLVLLSENLHIWILKMEQFAKRYTQIMKRLDYG